MPSAFQRLRWRLALPMGVLVGVAGCGDSTGPACTEVSTIVVSPTPATRTGVGATLQFAAVASGPGGCTLASQPTFTWASSDDAIATVSAAGLATAEDRGTVQISATVDAVSGSAAFTVLGILHWEDSNAATSTVPGALTQLGLAATDATSATDFVTLLQEGGWGLVIFGEQGDFAYSGNVQTELSAYVTGGGKLVAATWVETPLAPFLEATSTGTNYASLTTDAHAIFAGFGASVGITNPGYGTYAQRYTPTGTAECIGSTDAGDCAAILGHSGRTLLLGPLFDTYTTQTEGETLVAQSIEFVIDEP